MCSIWNNHIVTQELYNSIQTTLDAYLAPFRFTPRRIMPAFSVEDSPVPEHLEWSVDRTVLSVLAQGHNVDTNTMFASHLPTIVVGFCSGLPDDDVAHFFELLRTALVRHGYEMSNKSFSTRLEVQRIR